MYDIEPELKAKLVQLHVQEGRTFKSLSDEYGYPASTIAVGSENTARKP